MCVTVRETGGKRNELGTTQNKIEPVLDLIMIIIIVIKHEYKYLCYLVYNIVVAFEVLHSLRNRYSCKEDWFALKLDVIKAYNRVKWDFLKVLLEIMKFLTHFSE